MTVSMNGLIKRINRKLGRDLEMLRKARGQEYIDLGQYYVVNLSRNCVMRMHVDPVAFGRELGVLRANESVWGFTEVAPMYPKAGPRP
jgi:hypothetical protein